MGKKRKKAATPALQALLDAGVPHEVIEYEHSATMTHGYAQDTAEVLGVNPATVFKTLLAEVDGDPVVGVIPATSMLNLKALAKVLGGKRAQMMEPAAAETLTGYVTGGISPLGQRTTLPTVIDASAFDLPFILVSGGKRTISAKLKATDLARLTTAKTAGISTER